MFDWIGDILDGLFGIVQDAISTALGNFIGKLCYYAVTALLKVIEVVYRFFEVFSGGSMVKYQNSDKFLVDVFFGNNRINQVYWGMALIGFVIIVAVTILAVIKKSFDIDGKEQRSMGTILLDAGRSGLTILLVSFALTAVLNLTNIVIGRMKYLFNASGNLDTPIYMEFSDAQFATMARIYNTIGNYSLNESYNSRYNLNSCYNEIREDLLLLQDQQVFDFTYNTDGGETWQSMLAKLDRAGDPSYEHSIEVYDPCSTVLLEIMEVMRTSKNFYPVASVTNETWGTLEEDASIDRIIFLMGTLSAARNSRYNQDPQITDGLRGAYYRGEKNIYSYSTVSDDFNTGLVGISYVLIVLAGWFTLKNLFTCIFNCIARIFNLLGLYIIAPPIAGIRPLDGGAMFKQWIQATTIQMFGIFGCIIPMRLVILFIPIILDGGLEFFTDSVTMNVMAKVVMIIASMEAAQRFSGVITGILSGASGMAALRAGDMSDKAGAAFATAVGGAKAVGGAVMGGAAKVGKGLWDHSFVGAKTNTMFSKVGNAIGKEWNDFKDYAKFSKGKSGIFFSGGAWDKYKQSEQAKKAASQSMAQREKRVKLAKLAREERELGLVPPENAPENEGDDKEK